MKYLIFLILAINSAILAISPSEQQVINSKVIKMERKVSVMDDSFALKLSKTDSGSFAIKNEANTFSASNVFTTANTFYSGLNFKSSGGPFTSYFYDVSGNNIGSFYPLDDSFFFMALKPGAPIRTFSIDYKGNIFGDTLNVNKAYVNSKPVLTGVYKRVIIPFRISESSATFNETTSFATKAAINTRIHYECLIDTNKIDITRIDSVVFCAVLGLRAAVDDTASGFVRFRTNGVTYSGEQCTSTNSAGLEYFYIKTQISRNDLISGLVWTDGYVKGTKIGGATYYLGMQNLIITYREEE